MNEHGPGKGEVAPKVPVDIAAADLADLAGKLGA
jgi:2-haloacid dehalogenase